MNTSDAIISPDGRYRYVLTRSWPAGLFRVSTGYVCWVMLNPSTADAVVDDPTVKRCIDYTARWGFSRLAVVNLCAYRSKKPMLALSHAERFGPENRRHLWRQMAGASLVVFAWGAPGDKLPDEIGVVLDELGATFTASALGLTKSGQPRHPLFMTSSIGLADLQPWVRP